MKTLIVGDIHGKVEIVEDALAQEHPVIFVGDIADSFDRPVSDQIKCFDLIFKAIDEEKAKCLYGNHELSYIVNSMRCSGYNSVMAAHMDDGLIHQMAGRFKYYFWYGPNILITHAGLDKTIWDMEELGLETVNQALMEWVNNIESPAYWIGRSRGGWRKVGGIFWCDFDREFTEIPELVQIVGHTRGKDLRIKGNSYCIDYNDYNEFKPFYWDLPD